MKENKICFIICVNNQRYLEESLLYLNRLIVPEGYEVDILTIEGAKSMTSGYNEGMQASDAKYKIYMHQDVFITDIYFLQEMLDIFAIDPKIGMIGMVGTGHLPEDGVMWNADRAFAVYCKHNLKIENCDTYRKPTGDDIAVVQVVDGLMMVTQYDIPWREDVFTDWDFYDASQSLEFIKAGYYVVVPQLDKPMCVHDDGYILKLENYEDNRLKFLKEYEAYLKG